MESNLVCELKKQTGASEDLCYTLLQGQGWDLTSALMAYMQLADLAKHDDNSKYNISGSWRATHPDRLKADVDCVDGDLASSSLQEIRTIGTSQSNHRPLLQKADAVDLIDYKKLQRGISRATDNENIVSKVRSECAQDVASNNPSAATNSDQFYIETPEYTFTLPDITIYSEEFRKFLEKDLLETSTLVSLEQSGRLNWWCRCGGTMAGPLWPIATSGDGNCLPHAASLGLWGFHDRLLTLRKLLHSALLDAPWRHALKRRWRWTQTRQHTAAGLVLSSEEWRAEWEHVVERAAPAHHSLEEVHVFALAHTLRRPIIVIADVMLKDLNGEAMAPIPFGGVYLPLECSPEDCHKSPLLLAYDMGHFSALVSMDAPSPKSSTFVVPLTDSDGYLLPIQFSVDPGEDFDWEKEENDPRVINRLILTERDQVNLLSEYLDVIFLSPSTSPGQEEPDLINVSSEDITNKFSEVVNVYQGITDTEQGDHANMFDNKSKAAKQIHSVAKQFGSIGKSMSNKLKKNLGSITKIGGKANGVGNKKSNNQLTSPRSKILCCQLKAKRHVIQDEMVRNYLEYAKHRFLNSEQLKDKQESERKHFEMIRLREQAMLEGPLKCINAGCEEYGTAMTSYMCPNCYQKQREQELSEVRNTMNSPVGVTCHGNGALRYGTGKSKFYTESDSESHNVVKRMPQTTGLDKQDKTLYLSKSTFYNDTGKPSLVCAKSVNNLDAPFHARNGKSFRNGSSEDLINFSNDHNKKEKSKRSTLPAKVHSTEPNFRTGWDVNQSASNRVPHSLDIFNELQPCRTPFCVYYGSSVSNYLCSKCCETSNANQGMKFSHL